MPAAAELDLLTTALRQTVDARPDDVALYFALTAAQHAGLAPRPSGTACESREIAMHCDLPILGALCSWPPRRRALDEDAYTISIAPKLEALFQRALASTSASPAAGATTQRAQLAAALLDIAGAPCLEGLPRRDVGVQVELPWACHAMGWAPEP